MKQLGNSIRSAIIVSTMITAITAASIACGTGGGFQLVSLEEEWQLGQQLSVDIARQMPIVNDAQANRIVTDIGRRIVQTTAMRELPWGFHIIADPAINAFNIPGGHVYVTTGLIQAADDVSKFAGVMAHEIAHGVHRHGTQQLSRVHGMNILAGLVLGQNPATYQAILAQILGQGTIARFSRAAEVEADRSGVEFMHAAGYDPRGMPAMFQILLSQAQRQPGTVEKFFATHPLTQDRITDTNAQIQRMNLRPNLIRDDPAYQSLRSAIR
jgi:beta-barrel assembly-enhancing protease